MKTEFVMADEMDDKGRIYFIQNNKRHWSPSLKSQKAMVGI